MNRFARSTLILLALLLGAGATFAQTVTITFRGVEGGVNAQQVQWVRDYVIPEFESMHPGVNVELLEFGGSDEAIKEQYALDLSVGAGADVMGFDGFWIPEFVEGGLLEPLTALGGDAVLEWEGWDHIPEGLQGLMAYEGPAVRYRPRHRLPDDPPSHRHDGSCRDRQRRRVAADELG